jgi:hypothetical protein
MLAYRIALDDTKLYHLLQKYATFLYDLHIFGDALLICDESMRIVARLFGQQHEMFAIRLMTRGLFLQALER